MSSDDRRAGACRRLAALLGDQAYALALPTSGLLRELTTRCAGARADRRGLVEDAALVLSELVDQGQLSDQTADALWLALAGCAQAEHMLTRAAAEACIA